MTGAADRRPSRARGSSGRWYWIPVAAAAAVVLAGANLGAAAPAAVASTATATASWGRAVEVPGQAALNAGGDAQVQSVSCWRADYCAAGGFYTRKLGYRQAFVVLEHGGRWGKAAEVPGSAALMRGAKATESEVTSVSCWSPGNCGAVGFYYSVNNGRGHVFVVSQRAGRWGTAEQAPGTAALNLGKLASVTSVSCTRSRACVAAGSYKDRSHRTQAFVGGAT